MDRAATREERGPVKKNHNGRLAILAYGPPIFEPRAIDHSFIAFFFSLTVPYREQGNDKRCEIIQNIKNIKIKEDGS